MSEHGGERGATQVSSSSSESSQSIDSDPERLPLLTPDSNPESSSYKSTDIQNGVELASEETGSEEEEPSTKSVLAIISLLLIGISCSKFREEEQR